MYHLAIYNVGNWAIRDLIDVKQKVQECVPSATWKAEQKYRTMIYNSAGFLVGHFEVTGPSRVLQDFFPIELDLTNL